MIKNGESRGNQKNLPGGQVFVVSAKRLELLTNGLKGHCSAIELRALNVKEILSLLGGGVNRFLGICFPESGWKRIRWIGS